MGSSARLQVEFVGGAGFVGIAVSLMGRNHPLGIIMVERDQAEILAHSLVEVANGAGVKTSALITDMNQPLADSAGNAVEMRNCLDFLAGRKSDTRLATVVLAFAGEMLVKSGIAASSDEAERMARQSLSSGKAAEVFARMSGEPQPT